LKRAVFLLEHAQLGDELLDLLQALGLVPLLSRSSRFSERPDRVSSKDNARARTL
jgi:hypothetical protein